jgi:uncharacterized membrane protein
MEVLRVAVLIAATMTMGIVTGVFQLYSNTIMPGLKHTDDRTFVAAFQEIDKAIYNPWFMSSFFGALILTVLALALHLSGDERSVLPWVAGALVLYTGVFVSTLGVNVPLNDAIKAAGDPDEIADLAAVREQFDEAKWARWNLFRAVASTVALGCLVWALVQHGRS